MEAKYLYVVGAFIAFVLFSVIIANNKNDTQAEPITSFYELEAKLINGEVVRMEKYKGKKILIVNVASKCGLTPQYAQLEELYNKFSEKLIVLGFPSNQFLRQEPGRARSWIRIVIAAPAEKMADNCDCPYPKNRSPSKSKASSWRLELAAR